MYRLQKFVINPYKTIYAKDRATAIKIWEDLRARGVI